MRGEGEREGERERKPEMKFSYAIVCNIREDVPVLQIHVVGYKERFINKSPTYDSWRAPLF